MQQGIRHQPIRHRLLLRFDFAFPPPVFQVSFLEWVQNLQNFKWREEEVNGKLERGECAAWAGHLPPHLPRLFRLPCCMSLSLSCFVLKYRKPSSHDFQLGRRTALASPAAAGSVPPPPPHPPSSAPAVMIEAFEAIWELHTEDKIPLRTAAFVKALQRVTRARVHRGFD